MNFLKSSFPLSKVILFFIFFNLHYFAFSQNSNDSTQTKRVINFKGNLSVTNNGFSIIPSFSLGKPATIAVLAIGGKRFSFEPELRFALEGKPWSFIFWWRYKALNTSKFSLNIGIHPALNFRTDTLSINGATRNMMVSRRYLATEFYPSYRINKNIGIGLYFLHSWGLDYGTTKQTNYLALRSNLTIPLGKKLYIQFNPQVFYLQTDERDGFYMNSTLTLAKRSFPLSISSIMNKAIKTTIVSKDFDWNVSLVYSFNNQYTKGN